MKKFLSIRMVAVAIGLSMVALAPPAQAQLTHTIPLKVYPVQGNRVAVGDSANTWLEVGTPTLAPTVTRGQLTQVRLEVNGKVYRITNANFRRGDGTVWGANALAAVKAFNTPAVKFELLPVSAVTFAANTYRRIEVRVETNTATIQTGADAAVASVAASVQPYVFEGATLSHAVVITPAASARVYVTSIK